MSAKTEFLGALSIKYTGESPPEGKNGRKVKSGRQIGPTVVGSFGNVVLERRVDDVKYTLRATETTIQNLKAFNGAVLTVEKPFGPFTATGGLELGPVRALTANLKSKWNYSRQRFLELGAFWNERTNATTLTFTGQPHAKAKLTSVLNTKTQALRSVADLRHRGFTVSPGIDWSSGAKGVAVSHKFRSGTLKGSYAHEGQTAGLEYDFKPFKVAVTSKLSGKEAGKPSLLLTFKSDSVVRDVKNKTGWRSETKGQRRDGGVPDVARDIPLDRKLRELDELYAPKLAQAEAKRSKNDGSLASKTKS